MLLINPATQKFGGFLSRYVPVGIPVAIGYIAAYLEKNGIKCAVIDEEIFEVTAERLSEAVKGLEKPYIIGVSCLTAHVGRGYKIARVSCRRWQPSGICKYLARWCHLYTALSPKHNLSSS